MMDNKPRPRYAAPPRQVKADERDRQAWSRTLGVSLVQLEAAIAQVGSNVNDIARYLIERDYATRRVPPRTHTV